MPPAEGGGMEINMKKIRNIMAILAMIAICLNATPVYAAENTETDEKILNFDEVDFLHEIKEEAIESGMLREPAPPLSSLSLYMIFSEKGGTETVSTSPNDFPISSQNDHGGTIFRAITVEIGYAKTRFAYFNNIQMTLTAEEGFDTDNDNIIDGYFCLWTYSGSEFESGTFKAESTSVNRPWNTKSLSFHVR